MDDKVEKEMEKLCNILFFQDNEKLTTMEENLMLITGCFYDTFCFDCSGGQISVIEFSNLLTRKKRIPLSKNAWQEETELQDLYKEWLQVIHIDGFRGKDNAHTALEGINFFLPHVVTLHKVLETGYSGAFCFGLSPIVLSIYSEIPFFCVQNDLLGNKHKDLKQIFSYAYSKASKIIKNEKYNLLDIIKSNEEQNIFSFIDESVEIALCKQSSPSNAPIMSLKQKKLEVFYERQYEGIYDEKYHDAIGYKLTDVLIREKVLNAISGKSNPRVLDLACGPGSLTPYLSSIPEIDLIGVDISPTMVKQAKKRFPEQNFFIDDAENMQFQDEFFDVVLCSGALHHFHTIEKVVSEVKRVLKKGGFFIIREPNNDNFANRNQNISFLHLCLRSLINFWSEKDRYVEPEAHKFHRDFSYMELINEMSRDFNVTDIEFDQRVSYFYDLLTDKESEPYIRNIETTLNMQPGLNLILTLQKVDYLSHNASKISPNFKELSAGDVVSHLKSVYEFYCWAASKYNKNKKVNTKKDLKSIEITLEKPDSMLSLVENDQKYDLIKVIINEKMRISEEEILGLCMSLNYHGIIEIEVINHIFLSGDLSEESNILCHLYEIKPEVLSKKEGSFKFRKKNISRAFIKEFMDQGTFLSVFRSLCSHYGLDVKIPKIKNDVLINFYDRNLLTFFKERKVK